MIFVGKKRVSTKALGTDPWVVVGEPHFFVGDDPADLKAPCGARVVLRSNEAPTLSIPHSHIARTIYEFIENQHSCSDCVWWLRNHWEALLAAEKIGEEEK